MRHSIVGYYQICESAEYLQFGCLLRGRHELYMFYHSDVSEVDLARWEVSSVTTMDGMFAETTGIDFDIARWNVFAVKGYELFSDNQPIGG